MDREKAREKARALVARMTLEEKASQLRYDAPAIERLGVPAYNWWNEALHGVARGGTATSFPQAIGLAATFDDALVERLGDVAATEGRAKYNALSARGDRYIYHGLTFWSPNINIFRDPRWGRGHETYGEDPYLTSRMGQAYVRGLQGSGETMKAAACAKHFAVHSGPEALRHRFDAKATPKDMEETYLPAFRDLVTKAGVEAVMGAYNRTNGEPCCGSKALLVDTLRDAWGFAGHVVSDCWAVRDFHTGHMVTDTPQESAALGLSSDVKVVAGAGDNAAAAVGTGTVGAGGCNISLGTSGTIFISSNRFGVDPNNALHAFAHADGGWHLMGCMLSAASCNKWLCEDILGTADYAAEQAPITQEKLGRNHVFFLPYLMGERSPINDVDARGTFTGMTMDTTRADLVQAVLEGVAFAIRDSFEVAKSLGLDIPRSKLCGGGSKSPLWRTIFANVLGIPLDLVKTEQGPGYGGAMLAMVGCGRFESVRAAADALVEVAETVMPDPALTARYEAQYQKFRRIYPAMKDLFPAIQ